MQNTIVFEEFQTVPVVTLSDMTPYMQTAEDSQQAFPIPGEDFNFMRLDLSRAIIRNPASTFFVELTENSLAQAGYASGNIALVDRLGWLFDEPFADSSAMPTYRVCEAARKRVTVALSGDGGDENLAGYRRYRMHMAEEQLRSRLPLGLRKAVFGPLGAIYPKADWAPRFLRAKTTFQSLARDSVGAWFHSVSRMSDEQRHTLFSPALRSELGGYNAVEVLRGHAARAPTDHPLSLVQYLDLKTFLVSILHKVDRASMAHALEVRVPLLDHQLVEWMSGLRPEWKLAGGDGKHLFKQALKPYLPDDVMYRPKQGFSIPLAQWFRGPLREKYQREVLGESIADSGLFNNNYLSQLLQQHDSGLRDNSVVMWELLMFALSDRHLASH